VDSPSKDDCARTLRTGNVHATSPSARTPGTCRMHSLRRFVRAARLLRCTVHRCCCLPVHTCHVHQRRTLCSPGSTQQRTKKRCRDTCAACNRLLPQALRLGCTSPVRPHRALGSRRMLVCLALRIDCPARSPVSWQRPRRAFAGSSLPRHGRPSHLSVALTRDLLGNGPVGEHFAGVGGNFVHTATPRHMWGADN